MHINFEEDKKEVLDMSTDNDKKSLSDQVEKLKDLEDSIFAKEEELKQLKQQADAISGEVIPTMMQELNISTLKLADGSAVEVKPVYGASISAEKKEEACRNEDNKAIAYATLAQGQGFQPSQKLKVEPMTLKALVRERLESGKEMPTELFNVFAGNRTKITRKQ
jgi:hypothetical protein